jgi:APA family basic amino acid/polyamine antiporter
MGTSATKVVQLARRSLKKVIGTNELFAVGYGDIGSSIYYTLGATALYALGATPLALLLAGFAFLCTAQTYAEMSTTFSEAGGTATFARHAFNDLISFIAGWGLLLDYLLTLSISAFTIPPYLNQISKLFGYGNVATGNVHTLFVILIIVLLFCVNVVGLKSSGRMSWILAVFTLLTQAGIVILGVFLVLNLPYVIDHIRIGVSSDAFAPTWREFWKGTAMAMVAYTGIEAVSQLSAETNQPTKSIPKAIKWLGIVVVFLYIGLATVGLSVLTPQELGTTYIEDPISGIVTNFPVGGKFLGPWVGLIAAFILLIAANAGLIGCSRLIFSLGTRHQLPRFFAKLHPRFQTPHVALFVFSCVSIIIVIWSRNQMLLLADLYNFGAQIAFFFAHASLLVLRYKKPELERPYKAPFNIPIGKGRTIPLTAVIGVCVSFSVWMLVVIEKPDGRWAGLVWMAIGITLYILYRKREKLSIRSVEFEEIHIPEYRPVHHKNILILANPHGGMEALQMAAQLAKNDRAQLTAVCVLEIPEAVPFNEHLRDKERLGIESLKRTEAICREHGAPVKLELVRARSIEYALAELVKDQHYDLVVLSVSVEDFKLGVLEGKRLEKCFELAPSRVILCKEGVRS